jgi:hypothetical protein
VAFLIRPICLSVIAPPSSVEATNMADTGGFNTYEMSSGRAEKRVEQSVYESPEAGAVLSSSEWADVPDVAKIGFTPNDQRDMRRMGKKQEFRV